MKDVCIIRFSGGLGNQLFQYALYRKLLFLGKQVKADIRDYEMGREKRPFLLEKIGIRMDYIDDEDIARYSLNNPLMNSIKAKLGIVTNYSEKESYIFDPNVLQLEDAYIRGYWQCPHYYDDIRDILLKDIEFPQMSNNKEAIRETMGKQNSVSIHVRMGDYLYFPDRYGGICDKEYYRRALDIIESRVEDPIYYGFSDDIERAKDLLRFKDKIKWMEPSPGTVTYDDMNLMRSCKHSIIANSSYSWWGAYLGYAPQRVVIAPVKWINTYRDCEIWCDEWIKA